MLSLSSWLSFARAEIHSTIRFSKGYCNKTFVSVILETIFTQNNFSSCCVDVLKNFNIFFKTIYEKGLFTN